MRIALAGKGGAGKTTIAAALARLAAADSEAVVAIDGDSNPNLAAALGVPAAAAAALRPLPTSLVSRRLDGGPALVEDIADVLRAHGLAGPDGIRLLLMGRPAHADEGCMCSAHATVSAVMADLGAATEVTTIVDLEASPEHFGRGTARHADVLLLITEPYWRSLETSRRMAELARELPVGRVGVVGSKVRSAGEQEAVREFCDRHGLPLLGMIPRSETVVDADMAGRSLVDAAASGDPVIAQLHAVRGALQRLAT